MEKNGADGSSVARREQREEGIGIKNEICKKSHQKRKESQKL